MKPLIALTPSFHIERNEPYIPAAYLEAIRHAGAIPVILTADLTEEDLRQVVATFDGYLFTGGPDIHPFYFGEETHARCGTACPQRDTLELALLALVMEAKKPILGICRGIQLLNVGLGGTIYQDLPSEFIPEGQTALAHTQPFAYELCAHYVSVLPGTRLASLAQSDRLSVNSMHHQAVKKPGRGIAVTGYATDGSIEAIELPGYPAFFLGVQWHPEYLWKHDEAAARLFHAFVDAARQS